MNPTSTRLIEGARDALHSAAARCTDDEATSLLTAADALLNQLALRQDPAFFVEHHRRGRDLLSEGVALAGADAAGRARAILDALPSEADPRHTYDRTAELLDRVSEGLELVIESLDHSDVGSFPARAAGWENDLYLHQTSLSGTPTEDADPRQGLTTDRFLAWMRARGVVGEDARISRFEPISMGFSKNTIRVDVDDAGTTTELVLRAERPVPIPFFEGGAITNEFPVVRYAFDAGLPVAEPLWLEVDTAHLGVRFMVSRRALGINYGSSLKVERPLNDTILQDMAGVFARIHSLTPPNGAAVLQGSHLGGLVRPGDTMRDTTAAVVQHWRDFGRSIGVTPSPWLAHGFGWLLANVPDCDEPPVLTHCDYGLHNILIADDRVSAVLDWESAQLGDPAEEMCVYLDDNERFVSRDRMLGWYRDAGGAPIDEYRLAYFRVFYAVKATVHSNFMRQYYSRHRHSPVTVGVHGLTGAHHYTQRLDDAIARAEALQPQAVARR